MTASKLLQGFIAVAMVVATADAQPEESYRQQIEAWHATRLTSLKRDHGWLSLIALDWLKEGKNTVPAVGTLTLRRGVVSLALNGNGTVNGKPFTAGVIAPDKDKVIVGSKALSVIERSGKYAVRIWDAETPARKNFTTIERYPVSERWRIEAEWVPYDKPKTVDIPTVIPDLVQHGIAPGYARFVIDGTECRLEPTVEEEEYFFVFGDRTNGRETYGAGRFLYAQAPKEGKIVLDFNKAYNPPCVFTDYATCPVPTRENRLPVRIEAGEKNYRKSSAN